MKLEYEWHEGGHIIMTWFHQNQTFFHGVIHSIRILIGQLLRKSFENITNIYLLTIEHSYILYMIMYWNQGWQIWNKLNCLKFNVIPKYIKIIDKIIEWQKNEHKK